jgi:hypothetical protein
MALNEQDFSDQIGVNLSPSIDWEMDLLENYGDTQLNIDTGGNICDEIFATNQLKSPQLSMFGTLFEGFPDFDFSDNIEFGSESRTPGQNSAKEPDHETSLKLLHAEVQRLHDKLADRSTCITIH